MTSYLIKRNLIEYLIPSTSITSEWTSLEKRQGSQVHLWTILVDTFLDNCLHKSFSDPEQKQLA